MSEACVLAAWPIARKELSSVLLGASLRKGSGVFGVVCFSVRETAPSERRAAQLYHK